MPSTWRLGEHAIEQALADAVEEGLAVDGHQTRPCQMRNGAASLELSHRAQSPSSHPHGRCARRSLIGMRARSLLWPLWAMIARSRSTLSRTGSTSCSVWTVTCSGSSSSQIRVRRCRPDRGISIARSRSASCTLFHALIPLNRICAAAFRISRPNSTTSMRVSASPTRAIRYCRKARKYATAA